MEVLRSFENYWHQIVAYLPGIAAGIAVFIIGWLVAKLLRSLISRILRSAGVDAAAEKVGITGVFRKVGVRVPPSKMLGTLIYWIIMLAVIMAASNVMGISAISAALTTFLSYLPKIFTALVIVLIGALIADKVKETVSTLTESIGLNGGKVIASMLYSIIMVFVVITALNMAGIDTSLITSNIVLIVGAALVAFSIAYGFASRDILTNVLSSYYSKDRFEIGQHIKVGSDKGTIEKIDSLSVTLNTGNKQVMIPCSELITQRVEILSKLEVPTEARTKEPLMNPLTPDNDG